MSLLQDERVGKLTTPLGDNVLALARFDGGEHLSEPFEFRIEAVSEQQNIDFNAALGKSVTVDLKTADGADRYFNGILCEARWVGMRSEHFVYRLVVRPWFWLLSLTSDCRIFSQKSPKDIIKQVFSDRGFSDFRDELKSSYPTLEYCVQYRETDFDFVSRLMEQYGMYYFFEHSDGVHTLVLADMKASHKPVADLQTMPFLPVHEGALRALQHIDEWSRDRSVESGIFKLNDYDYNKPGANLLADSEKPGGYTHDSMEMYDYIGEYSDLSVGNKLAQVEAEAAQSLDDRRTATGTTMSLFPGGLVTLKDHPVDGENQEYLVVACSHYFHAQSYRSGNAQDGVAYSGNFEFTPSSRQFRAELDTDRPRISGFQSALVVGKDGEEIDVDKLGRITVQFYWDRKKKPSRRVRIAQFWAGSKGHRGALFVPRIGDEVLIQYEEGDPDRPIVVGSVYNGDNTVPTHLPEKKTNSGILTKSSKNSDGYHMLLFDDTAGQEKLKLRSQKDLMFKALNNEQRDILMDQTENVGKDETINVGMDMAHDMSKGGGNWTLNAFKSATINVGPQGMPMTQIKMTQTDITFTFFMGPIPFSQTVLDASGIRNTVMMGLTQHSWTPGSTSLMSPTINETAMAAINMMAPTVNAAATLMTPALVAGGAIVGGIPI